MSNEYTFTNRYEALGIPEPVPETMCAGQCEGTGVYPLKAGDFADAVERGRWQQAHDTPGAHEGKPCDGWHFITCPDCNGTGNQV